MATTTNYSWTTPDDTDLVKDGASAIRTLGSSIDTTTKNLNPQTTTGAIAYRSATSNVNTSLPIGTAGQVLTVNSGATAPEWKAIAADSLTLLSTTTLTGATTTISGISGSYKKLYLQIEGVTNATANGIFRMATNGATNLTSFGGYSLVDGAAGTYARDNDYLRLSDNAGQLTRTNSSNSWFIEMDNYANTTYNKMIFSYGYYVQAATSTACLETTTSIYKSTSAVTSLVFSNSGGNLSTGTVRIYGVN